jgi:hypothetical protein
MQPPSNSKRLKAVGKLAMAFPGIRIRVVYPVAGQEYDDEVNFRVSKTSGELVMTYFKNAEPVKDSARERVPPGLFKVKAIVAFAKKHVQDASAFHGIFLDTDNGHQQRIELFSEDDDDQDQKPAESSEISGDDDAAAVNNLLSQLFGENDNDDEANEDKTKKADIKPKSKKEKRKVPKEKSSKNNNNTIPKKDEKKAKSKKEKTSSKDKKVKKVKKDEKQQLDPEEKVNIENGDNNVTKNNNDKNNNIQTNKSLTKVPHQRVTWAPSRPEGERTRIRDSVPRAEKRRGVVRIA